MKYYNQWNMMEPATNLPLAEGIPLQRLTNNKKE
jgi:hypothetical protein